MFSSWSKLQFRYICNEAQWAKKKLKNGANFGNLWIPDYLKYYPLAFGVTLWKKKIDHKSWLVNWTEIALSPGILALCAKTS